MRKRVRAGERGAALIAALSLLVIFTLFGTYFVNHMGLELSDANVDLRETRARLLAESGVRAAVLEVKQALAADGMITFEKRATLQLPTFRMTYEGGETKLVERTRTPEFPYESAASATYVIEDENAKLNLNHAPVSAMADVLGLQRFQVLKIVSSLPHGGGEGAWLGHLDDLRTRGLLTAGELEALPRDLVTVSTVLDNENPEPHINLAAAPEAVAAAVQTSAVMAEAVTSSSNTFRVYCEGVYESDGKKATAHAEALLRFDADGTHRILEWRTEGVALPALPVVESESEENDA